MGLVATHRTFGRPDDSGVGDYVRITTRQTQNTPPRCAGGADPLGILDRRRRLHDAEALGRGASGYFSHACIALNCSMSIFPKSLYSSRAILAQKLTLGVRSVPA